MNTFSTTNESLHETERPDFSENEIIPLLKEQYNLFNSKPSIFGKFAIFSLSAAHDRKNIAKKARKVKEDIFFILSTFSRNTINISF